jgi:hypothetical protein
MQLHSVLTLQDAKSLLWNQWGAGQVASAPAYTAPAARQPSGVEMASTAAWATAHKDFSTI